MIGHFGFFQNRHFFLTFPKRILRLDKATVPLHILELLY
ncbi:hypothetical protein MEG1DRAFT_02471 [Photorhabdus temperata subsp. temperata Meg1]|uniref:Uncharacterized protein n=1 Tax=Photorhabdus temperata subsp. temperata Meg1 TaxID=1393735 RepID=A0A081RW60_PHOTE|nr:hypothetical protein MEG1DRAFT_02471 [Photorhabdus temperata subsp. temperata Meg1]